MIVVSAAPLAATKKTMHNQHRAVFPRSRTASPPLTILPCTPMQHLCYTTTSLHFHTNDGWRQCKDDDNSGSWFVWYICGVCTTRGISVTTFDACLWARILFVVVRYHPSLLSNAHCSRCSRRRHLGLHGGVCRRLLCGGPGATQPRTCVGLGTPCQG